MNIGLSLSLGVTALMGVSAAVKNVVAGIFSSANAKLEDVSHVSGVTNGPVWTSGQYRIATPAVAATISMNIAAMANKVWISARLNKDDEETGQGWRFRGLAPTYDPLATRVRGGNQVFKLTANTGSVSLQSLYGTGLVGTLVYAQPVQMEAILAQPWDIYVAIGQSQMAAANNALGIDPAQDDWTDPTLLYFPGSTYAGHATVIGTVDALRAPLQANTDGGGAVVAGYRSNGVSPAIAFAKAIRAATANGRNIVIVQAAVSSTNLLGSGGAWNPSGTTPFAYNHAVGLIAGAMAAAPAGSKIKGVLWAQGESDLTTMAADMTVYPPAWAAMRTAFETTWTTNSWTDAPVVWMIATTPPDAVSVNVPNFIAMQNKMDSTSGDALSQPRCRVVNRGPGVEADGIHATASSNRAIGAAMAARFLAGA